MKTKVIHLTIALLAGAASAREPQPENGHRPPPPVPPILAIFDADRDGGISAAFAKLDKNSDGEITRDELRPPPPQRPEDGDAPEDGDRPPGPPPGRRPPPPVIAAAFPTGATEGTLTWGAGTDPDWAQAKDATDVATKHVSVTPTKERKDMTPPTLAVDKAASTARDC